MNNLWKSSFIKSDMDAPYNIVKEQCNFLRNGTDGIIVAKVVDFDASLFINLTDSGKIVNDINKNSFGLYISDNNKVYNKFTYEFYITTSYTLNYKYRILLFQYGIPFYPLTIITDENISNELALSLPITCETYENFIITLEKILNSKTVLNVISSLLKIAYENEKLQK